MLLASWTLEWIRSAGTDPLQCCHLYLRKLQNLPERSENIRNSTAKCGAIFKMRVGFMESLRIDK